MKNVIITGATGSIGINFVNYLIKNNIYVTAIVRSIEKAKHIFNSPNIVFIESDLNNLDKLNILNKKYDVFYHLAWEGTRGKTRDDIDKQVNNIKYTMEAIELCNKIKCPKFVGVGSQAECGRVEGIISDKTIPQPETAYGIAKWSSLKLGMLLAQKYNINFSWARIISVYGPFDDENTMIMSSIRAMLNGNSIDYTKAEQLWDYVYVEDVAKALYLIGKKGKNESIYCIGSGKTEPLSEYIKEIQRQINPNIKLNFGAKEYSPNQVMKLCVDISKLENDTNYKAEIGFKEGISKTIQWYKENM